jgi:hypothetical protein
LELEEQTLLLKVKVLVELKAIIQLEEVHLAQALNYLKAYRLEVGLLINFGSKSLTFKRVVLKTKSVKSLNQIKSVIQTIIKLMVVRLKLKQKKENTQDSVLLFLLNQLQ